MDGSDQKIGGQFQPVGIIEELSSAANHLVATVGRTTPLLKGTPTPDFKSSSNWGSYVEGPADDVDVTASAAAPVVEAPVVIGPHRLHHLGQ